jgi:hypothetical protein
MLNNAVYAPLDISLASRARRVEALAETAITLAETYEREGRWSRALALINAVLRDPDVPSDRSGLAARLRACRGRLLFAEALYETNDFDLAISALAQAAELANEVGDRPTAELARENLDRAYAAQAASDAASLRSALTPGEDPHATQPLDVA